jgi:hypothetical protein
MIFMSNTHVFWKQISSAFFSLTNTEPDLSPFFDPEIITEYDPDNPAQFDEEIYSRWFAWCSVCGFPFVRITANKEFCSRECARPASRNTKRTEIRAAHDLTFIGIDGEGVSTYSDDGKITRHDYVLMIAAGDGIEPMILHKNGKRLTTSEIFEWLYFTVHARYPHACVITFAMGYDFSQWVRDLPQSRAFQLLRKEGIASRKRTNSGNNTTPFPVRWRDPARPSGEWEFDTLGHNRLKLRWRERPYRDYSKNGVEGATKACGAHHEDKGPPYMYIATPFHFFSNLFCPQ